MYDDVRSKPKQANVAPDISVPPDDLRNKDSSTMITEASLLLRTCGASIWTCSPASARASAPPRSAVTVTDGTNVGGGMR